MAENGRLWLSGLRRAWNVSGTLARWVEEQGVTGVVWTPASYETDDLAEAGIKLVDAGARVDWSLFWDLAVDDIRAAADALRPALSSSDWKDGFVAVWLDPARLNDPQRAIDAAGDLALDVRFRSDVERQITRSAQSTLRVIWRSTSERNRTSRLRSRGPRLGPRCSNVSSKPGCPLRSPASAISKRPMPSRPRGPAVWNAGVPSNA